jgi:hypothetical protein
MSGYDRLVIFSIDTFDAPVFSRRSDDVVLPRVLCGRRLYPLRNRNSFEGALANLMPANFARNVAWAPVLIASG